jgi:peptidyl-prolyl cis-trans isomerase A (cyclophilin A)
MPALAQKVKLATSAGDIVVELDAAKAPKTVDNFLPVRQGGPLRRHGASTA